MSFKVSKRAIVHYFLLYIALSFQGSVIYKIYDSYFMIIALGCTAFFFVGGGYRRLNKGYASCMIIVCALLLANHFYTGGSTSIGTVGNFFSRFCIAYLCVAYDQNRVRERLLNIIVFIAGVNLFEYFLGLTPARTIFSAFPTLDTSGSVYHCSIFYAAKLSDLSRNNGMYGEPGVYQIILNVGLILLLFGKNEWLADKKRRNYLIVLLLALITAQSTTGYLAMLIILTAFVFSNSEHKENQWLKICVLCGTLLFAGIAIYGGTDSFIYERFTSKLFGGSGVDLSASTGRYREISMMTDMVIAWQNPMGVGTDMYKIWWINNVYDWSNTNGSVVGLTRYCATYGFLTTAIMVMFIIRGMYKNKNSLSEFIAIIGAFVVTVISQPHILYAIYLLLMYPIVRTCKTKNGVNSYGEDYRNY